jgi:hypothetical protein
MPPYRNKHSQHFPTFKTSPLHPNTPAQFLPTTYHHREQLLGKRHSRSDWQAQYQPQNPMKKLHRNDNYREHVTTSHQPPATNRSFYFRR